MSNQKQTESPRASDPAVGSSDIVRRRMDEHTVAEYLKFAGPLAAAIGAPPMVAAAVKRLQADDDATARERQRNV